MGKIAFSYEPKACFLSRIVPAFKLLYLILLSILISTAKGYELYIYTVLLLLLGILSKLNPIKLLVSMPAMLIIALFIAITEWISTKSINMAIKETLSFIDLLLLALLFMATTDITELACSLGHYTSPILGKRAWKLSSNIMLTLALLPMIFSSATTMLQARRSRCGRFFKAPIRNMTEYTISLILLLFKRAEIFEDALLSRSYSESAERKTKKATFYDILTLICVCLLTIMIFQLRKLF